MHKQTTFLVQQGVCGLSCRRLTATEGVPVRSMSSSFSLGRCFDAVLPVCSLLIHVLKHIFNHRLPDPLAAARVCPCELNCRHPQSESPEEEEVEHLEPRGAQNSGWDGKKIDNTRLQMSRRGRKKEKNALPTRGGHDGRHIQKRRTGRGKKRRHSKGGTKNTSATARRKKG